MCQSVPVRTLPEIKFRLLLVSPLSNCEVALVVFGTELEFVNTRVKLAATDPLLEKKVRQMDVKHLSLSGVCR